MNELSNAKDGAKKKQKGLALPLILGALVVVLGAGGAYLATQYMGKNAAVLPEKPVVPKAEGPLARFATGKLSSLITYAVPRAAPPVKFNDRDGKPSGLEAFKGKVVVLNLWATWCAPCKVEMPTLAALASHYADDVDVAVVPVSLDTNEMIPDARSFIDVHDPLPLYHDPAFSLPSQFDFKGMPATVIIDKQGRVVAELSGETDWNAAEVHALIDHLRQQN
ncbi:MAG: redoxin domain-containing protein [Asticcacaulis sp.]